MRSEILLARAPNGAQLMRGEWRVDADGRYWVCCPTCGQVSRLGAKSIDPRGWAEPSWHCTRESCAISGRVRLLQYEGEA